VFFGAAISGPLDPGTITTDGALVEGCGGADGAGGVVACLNDGGWDTTVGAGLTTPVPGLKLLNVLIFYALKVKE
jgi:hypothetical protein